MKKRLFGILVHRGVLLLLLLAALTGCDAATRWNTEHISGLRCAPNGQGLTMCYAKGGTP